MLSIACSEALLGQGAFGQSSGLPVRLTSLGIPVRKREYLIYHLDLLACFGVGLNDLLEPEPASKSCATLPAAAARL